MQELTQRHPTQWVLTSTGTTATHLTGNLAGSAAAPRSLADLIALSADPATTRANLDAINTLPLGLGAYAGDAALRETIATELYPAGARVEGADVVVTNATTGANLLVFQTLLQRGDHVIALYPCYGQLVQFPSAVLGAEVSFWRLRPEKDDWRLDLGELKRLIRTEGGGRTKMLVLNNPHNPTGTVISTALQREIVRLCAEHDITIFCDEIFRPLFHVADPPTSLIEHAGPEFDKVVVTGSLSKPYGLSGIRIGWAVSRNAAIRDALVNMRQWTLSSASVVDEVVAREALSPRLRSQLLQSTLDAAKENLGVLRALIGEFEARKGEGKGGRIQGPLPSGGGTVFLRIVNGEGSGVDDVAFCSALKDAEGVLLAPGSLTFGVDEAGAAGQVHTDGGVQPDFQGYVRVHVTAPPAMFRRGLEGLRRFLLAGDGRVKA